MASLRITLGFVPSTEKIESSREKIYVEWSKLKEIEASPELKRFHELDKFINSDEFTNRRKEIENQKFSDTEEYKKEQEYLELKKDKDLKTYYSVKESKQLVDFQNMQKSQELAKFKELEDFLSSESFKKVKEYMALSPKKKFEQSKEYTALQDYQKLKNLQSLKNYFKFIKLSAYKDFRSFDGSKELAEFEELEKLAASSVYTTNPKQLPKDERATNEEYQKVLKYKELSKSKKIKNYKKLQKSKLYNDYLKMKDSGEVEAFQELEKFVKSNEFKEAKKKTESQKFKDTPEYKKEQEFLKLKKSKAFKDYFKFKDSKDFETYNQVEKLEKLTRFEKLEEFVNSEEFYEVKTYMNLSAKKKFEQSEEKQMQDEYDTLKNNENIKYYQKNISSKKYDELRTWEITFSDDFEEKTIDVNRWCTRYFWGDKLLKDSYSLASDKHFITKNNLKVEESALKIITKKEHVRGKAWDPDPRKTLGFFEKDFEFTSGVVNTGNSFRQQYGRFEAKIRFNKHHPVNHAFWMVSDKKVPHVDVVKSEKHLSFNNFWMNGSPKVNKNINLVKTSRYNSKYYIYSLDWTPEYLEWKINGITVAKQTKGIPDTPMYIAFSSGLYTDFDNYTEPIEMDIDWVRCYKSAEV